MVKILLKFFEDFGVLDEVSLHVWRHLVVEVKLFHNKVKIKEEGLLNISSNVLV